MTNTLHRSGSKESFDDDYIVFALPARGINDQDAPQKLRRFLEIARNYNPVNMGDASHGSIFRPSKKLNPTVHWKRDAPLDFDGVLKGVSGATTVAVVFDNPDNAVNFIKALREAELGISVNISAGREKAQEVARLAGIERHSVEYSLGFFGQTDRMSDRGTLELSTMCGHGMLSADFVRKLVEWVKQGRRTPEQASAILARFCSCGIFNPTRARRLFEDARKGS